ncbi:hypothetical protein Cme02nite_38250 [Catellatospora methionotrophica]|uniref:Uncharacterized protein n=1 Tax=Catellatospora methionotrophica TaxID=121620 RepID=A0A8J3LC85_9ACTN|nr:hypothetical protein [Catellatospora methionotrophica]GIG15493.1 hypothetical protein Cme02nite_38250 [Catellatospora methionotrophica]
MDALGRLFDVVVGSAPADSVAAAITGNRVHLQNAGGVTILVLTDGGSTDILDVDVQQATAATGGSIIDLDVVTKYYLKEATTFAGSETWSKVTQAAASEITNAGSASKQTLVVIEVDAAQLSDGYEWISLNVPDQGSNGTKYTAVLYLLRDLHVQRAPQNLRNPQA